MPMNVTGICFFFFLCGAGGDENEKGRGADCGPVVGQLWALGFEGMNESLLSYLTEKPRRGESQGG